jgi:hypothetical protein
MSRSPIALVGLVFVGCGTSAADSANAKSNDPQTSVETPRAPTVTGPAKDAPAPSAEPESSRSTDVPRDSFAAPQAAMDAFTAAMKARDGRRVLQCFSKKRPFLMTQTGMGDPVSTHYSVRQLERGLAAGGDFRRVFFGDDDGDSLRDFFEHENGWSAYKPLAFVPTSAVHESSAKQLVIVRWAKDGARYVVAELSFPH